MTQPAGSFGALSSTIYFDPNNHLFETNIEEDKEMKQVPHKISVSIGLDVITNEVSKFTQAQDISDQKLGYMYFLIGLGSFSRGCFETHYEWLSLMF